MDFAEYAATSRATLLRSAVLLGCTPHDAEDLVQVTLTKCFTHWRKIAQAERPDAYVYRILLNALRDNRARFWHGELATDVLPEHPLDPIDPDDGLAVRRALAALSKEHRDVLVLRFYADLSERETARVLRVPAGTVKSRTARALAALSLDQNITRSH